MDDRKHRHIVSLGKCISNSPPNQCLSALHFNYYQAFEDILNVLRNRVIDLEFELAYLWSNVDILSQEYVTMWDKICLLYTSPSPRDRTRSRMPSSA